MFYCNNDFNEFIRHTNGKLDKLNVWFSVDILIIKHNKTRLHDFWKSRIENVSLYKKKNVIINRVEATKFLSVFIDNKLTSIRHISLLKSKLSKCCAVMYKTSFSIDRCGIRILYYLFFALHCVLC